MINKKEIIQLLSDGKTEMVVDKLVSINFNDAERETESIALSARFKKYIKEKHGNLSDSADLDIEINRINAALLHFINKLPENNIAQKKGTLKIFWSILLGIIGILAGIAGFSGYTLKDVFKKGNQTVIDSSTNKTNIIPEKQKVEKVEVEKPVTVVPFRKTKELPERQQQNTNSIHVGRDNNGVIQQNNNQGDVKTSFTIPAPVKKDEN